MFRRIAEKVLERDVAHDERGVEVELLQDAAREQTGTGLPTEFHEKVLKAELNLVSK